MLFADEIPSSAEEVSPLPVGEKVPTAHVRNRSGERLSIEDILSNKPTLLVFFRGGWCPYCNSHLGEIASIEKQLVDMGFQIIAVSPDMPQKIVENSEKLKEAGVEPSGNYQIFSDSKMELAKAFGLAFRVEPSLVSLHKDQYGIDIEADSGETHHLLPVPAAYVINKEGAITFRHYDSDYKKRISPEAILEAAARSTSIELVPSK